MHTIVCTTGAVVEIVTLPLSVVHHAWESSTEIHAFCEAENVVLPKDVAVNISAPDIYNDLADLTPASIPAGTAVSSHLLHLDPVDTQRQALLIGSVTFNADILGVIVLNEDMDRSTETLGAPGITYPLGDLSERTLDPQADVVEVAPDRRTVSVQLDTRDTMDQIRVITAGCCALLPEGADRVEAADQGLDLTRQRPRTGTTQCRFQVYAFTLSRLQNRRGNVILLPEPRPEGAADGRIECLEWLGGALQYYERKAV